MFLNREETKEKLAKVKSRRIKRIALVTVAAVGGGVLIGQLSENNYKIINVIYIALYCIATDIRRSLNTI